VGGWSANLTFMTVTIVPFRTDWPSGPIWHILGGKVDSALVQNGLGEEGCRTEKVDPIVHSGTGEEVP
jgi:hypothetical protein